MKFRKLYKKYKFFLFLLPIIIAILLINNSLIFNTAHLIDISNKIVVHYIDVGQGDCILVQVNNKNLLIDSGPKESKKQLLSYLNSITIKKIDYVIATHPHDDHIGNMSTIIKNFDINKFYAPKITTTTSTFEQMIDSLKYKKLKINILKEGITSIDLGKDVTVTVFSPCKEYYDNLNNYSAVIKIKYKNSSFLFVGDAEKEIESNLINNNSISSDVLKIGHHGSSTSSTDAFIKRVNPSIGIISVGKDNKFNHPNSTTLKTLSKNNVTLYRTDKDNTIILSSDGYTIQKLS